MCGEPLVLIFTLHLDNSESAEQGRLPFCSEVKNGGTRSAVTPFRGERPRLYLCDGKMANTSRSHPINQTTHAERGATANGASGCGENKCHRFPLPIPSNRGKVR